MHSMINSFLGYLHCLNQMLCALSCHYAWILPLLTNNQSLIPTKLLFFSYHKNGQERIWDYITEHDEYVTSNVCIVH